MEWEAQCLKPTYLESLLDEKADDIGRTTGEQKEDAIREYGALELRLELINSNEGRFCKQLEYAKKQLDAKLREFYQMALPQDVATVAGELLSLAKTLGRIQGELAFLESQVNRQPE